VSAFRQRLIRDRFDEARGGPLTASQVAQAAGAGWIEEVEPMRKAGYMLIEEASGDWYLEDVPELDVGCAVDRDAGEIPLTLASLDPVDGAPDVDPVPLFETEPARRSPLDAEAA
jgi:hypothetical protein